MKRLMIASLTLLATLSVPAQADPLVNLVLEKKVMGAWESGNQPMINPLNYQVQNFETTAHYDSKPVQTLRQTSATPFMLKQYELVQDPEQYQSLIRIRDLKTQQVRSHLNVGRRIHRMVADPQRHRLYVLCGGYFGSIWEIDTQRDVVLRKLPAFTPQHPSPPLWNPRDMALLSDGQTLAVGSSKVQLIDLQTGQIKQEIPLPAGAVAVTAVQARSGNGAGFAVYYQNGAVKPYHLNAGQTQLQPGGGATVTHHPVKIRLQTAHGNPPPVSKVFFMASRNSDYIRMVDRDSLRTLGILPLDFNVDDLVLSTDRNRLFAYHQRFGQISVIELNARTQEQFSVIHRYRDQRFIGQSPMRLAASAGQVFLWDGESQITASFEAESLYPRIGLPFQTQLSSGDGRVWVSFPAHQRYALKEGQIFAEYIGNAPSVLPMKLNLGAPVLDMVLSPDRHWLYALTDTAELVVMNAATHEIMRRRNIGLSPRYVSLSSQGQRLLVSDADQGLLREYQISDLRFTRQVAMDLGLSQPYQLTLYEPQLAQVVEVELPRHLTDVVRLAH